MSNHCKPGMEKSLIHRIGWCAIAFAVAIVAGVGAFRIFAGDRLALALTVQDDSFYYLVPAHLFWKYGYITFDGHNPTYGFQPLYMAVLVALSAFLSDIERLFQASLLVNLICYCGTALLVYSIAARMLEQARPIPRLVASLGSATLFLNNAGVYFASTTGKENALAALLLAASIRLLLARVWPRNTAGTGRQRGVAIGFGMVAGLLLICRILPTTFLEIAVLGSAALWRRGSRGLMLAALALFPLLWSAYAWAEFHCILPTSGSAKMSSTTSVLSSLSREKRDATLGTVANYLRSAVGLTAGHQHVFDLPQPDAWTNGGGGDGRASRLFRWQRNTLQVLAMLGLLVFGVAFVSRIPGGVLLFGLGAASVVGLTAVVVLLGEERRVELNYFSWYLFDLPVPLSLLVGLSSGLLLEQCTSAWSMAACGDAASQAPSEAAASPGRTRCILAVLAAGFVVAATVQVHHPMRPYEMSGIPQGWQQVMARCGMIVRDELGGPKDRVAALSAGMLGYLMPGRVVNLDGLANDRVTAFLKSGGTFQQYLEQERITWYVDVLTPERLGLNAEVVRTMPMGHPDFPDYFIAKMRQPDDAAGSVHSTIRAMK